MLRPTGRMARNHWLAAGLISAFVFFIYLFTMARHLTFIDCGELATVCSTLGIAHPTGYPLFTLIGRLFSILPFGERILLRLNLMSALFSAGAVFSFYFVIVQVLDVFPSITLQKKLKPAVMLFAIAGSLLLGFSLTFWSQATVIEVYSLHTLFVCLILLLLLLAVQTPHLSRFDVLLAYVLGLSFANHMTTILLVPGILYLIYKKCGPSAKLLKYSAILSLPFILGLSTYLYLPIRAAHNPLLNWGDPDSFFTFFNHISGKQYRVWISFSSQIAGKQFSHFLGLAVVQFTPLVLPFMLLGFWWLTRQKDHLRTILIFTTVVFVSCVLYAINYDIHDIDSYFLTAFIVMAIWFVAGLVFVYELIYEKPRHYHLFFSVAVLIVSMIPLFWHASSVNQHGNMLVRNYTHNMLETVEDKGLIISYQWDFFVSPFLYLHHVEDIRPDVAVLDKELFRRSWYFDYIKHVYPALFEKAHAEIDAFLKELYKFEHNLPYNPAVIQANFERMILKFVAVALAESRPVYVTSEIEPEFTRGYTKIPHGTLFRLVEDGTRFLPVPKADYQLKDIRAREARTDNLSNKARELTALMFMNTGTYLLQNGQREDAAAYYRLVLEIVPNHPGAIEGLKAASF